MAQLSPANKILLFIIFLLTIIVYLPSLSVPFYLDDIPSITNSPTFTNGNVAIFFQIYGMRVLGYLTLYGNYLLSGDEVFSYHVVNLAIHLLNGFILYKLYCAICDYFKIKPCQFIGILIVALWLLHPLNIQAVTYIVQRLASLVSLFVLVCLFSYLRWRVNTKFVYLFVAIMSFVLAILTKQNAVFLPVFILLMELFFAEKKISTKLVVIGGISFLIFALIYPFISPLMQQIDMASRETLAISRLDYFNTQLYVHWLYLKKFLLIEPLALTIDVDLIKNNTLISWLYLLHLTVLAIAIFLRKKVPLVTFAIIFYYCAHLVESSIIPITDLAFEHRTYLPNIGLVLVIAAILHEFTSYMAVNKLKRLQFLFNFSTVVIVLLLAVTTYQRNILWQQPTAFYQHEFMLAPNNPRNLETIGRYYALEKNYPKAVELLTKSLNLNVKKGKFTASSLSNLMKVYIEQNNFQGAIIVGQKGLTFVKKPANKSSILSAMAIAYSRMNLCDFASGLATTAVKLNPYNLEAKSVLTYCKVNK